MKTIIRKPLVSEKTVALGKDYNKYVFLVDNQANSQEVKKVVENIYKVKVVTVNLINQKGKVKRLGRSLGRRSDFKKAIVTVKAGQIIDILPK